MDQNIVICHSYYVRALGQCYIIASGPEDIVNRSEANLKGSANLVKYGSAGGVVK